MGRPDISSASDGLTVTGHVGQTVMDRELPQRPFVPGTISVPLFEAGVPGVLHAFGTRSASELRGSLSQGAELDLVSVKQVHGTEILFIPKDMDCAGMLEAAAAQGYDAIVTNRPGTWVTVRTADCVPILLMDPTSRVVAAVHAGWRGTLGRIAAKVVHVMHQRLGCGMATLRAVIGPSIGRCCYEVDEPVLAPLKHTFSYWTEVVTDTQSGRGRLDLCRLNQRQLEDLGLKSSHISMVNLCTACHPNLFYSYRRDGQGTRHMTSGIALL